MPDEEGGVVRGEVVSSSMILTCTALVERMPDDEAECRWRFDANIEDLAKFIWAEIKKRKGFGDD